MAKGFRTIVWLEPHQAAMVRAVADRVGLELVGAGCPEPKLATQVASALGVAPHDDLRATLASADCDVLLIASAGLFGHGLTAGEAGAIDEAASRSVRIVTLDPMPASAMDASGGRWERVRSGRPPIDAIRFVPLLRTSRVLRELADPIGSFEFVRTMWVEAVCRPEQGTLGSRLFAACDLVVSVLGVPELVDAAFARPLPGRSLHALPGDTLRGLSGDMTLNLRFADGRACGIIASDRAARWSSEVRLLGEGGEIRAGEGGFTWLGGDGGVIETWVHPEGADRSGIDAIAAGLVDALDGRGSEGPIDVLTVLSVTQAALLSARTGQAESPETMRRIGAVG